MLRNAPNRRDSLSAVRGAAFSSYPLAKPMLLKWSLANPMAVNARCSGIFSGLLAGWLLIPVVVKWVQAGRIPLKLLVGAFLLNCVDFTAGFFPVWNSSNFSRFFSGMVLGLAVAVVMTDLFRKFPNDKEQIHGTDRS